MRHRPSTLAVEHADSSVLCYAKTACILLRAAIACEHGDQELAWQLLLQSKEEAAHAGYRQFELEGRLLETYFYFINGEAATGFATLRQAMDLGGGQHGLVPFMLQRKILAELSTRVFVEKIQTGYAQKIVQVCQLQTPQSPQEVEEWPWMFRVYTLGRFGLVNFGKKLPYAAKKKTKPLAFLKAILAFGGRKVSEMNIMDALVERSRR